jgi:hypothetical protein
MSKYYLVNWKIKKYSTEYTEQEMYCSDPSWGCGDTVIEFTDGELREESECFELSWKSFKKLLIYIKRCKYLSFLFGSKYPVWMDSDRLADSFCKESGKVIF